MIRFILKNLIGLALLAAGIPLLLSPGPGMLVLLLGISLLDFPGKRRLLCLILSQPTLRKTINWVRQQRNQPPLQFPDHDDAGSKAEPVDDPDR
ncbi:PGPGW domain-containing protein [Planctomicrobium sp. SH664]|uniref:PGPGW domain-containing protein n=1 Tax=Planctomicrobium sp. SH664 TaxID=3448125 RepID=UPI003F5B0E1F